MRSSLVKAVLYIPAVAGLATYYYVASTDIGDTVIVLAAAVLYLVFQLLVDESLPASTLNAYLLMGVLGAGVLIKPVKAVTLVPYASRLSFVGLVAASAVVWALAVAGTINSLRVRYSRAKAAIKGAALVAASLAIVLYLSVEEVSVRGEEVVVLVATSAAMTLMLALFDRYLFINLIRLAKSGEGGDADSFVLSLILTAMIFALTAIVVTVQNVGYGQMELYALAIAYSYYYASAVLGLVSLLFIVHGTVVEDFKPGTLHLVRAVTDYYRLRYVPAIINVANHLESIGNRGRKILNTELAKIIEEGIRRVKHRIPSSATRTVNDVLEAVEGARVVRLKKEIYEALMSVDDAGRLAKSVEARVLKIIGGGEGSRREIKQLKGELRSALRRASDSAPIEAVIKALEDGDLGALVEERPMMLRDLRNLLAHGRLTRELLLSSRGIPEIAELVSKPAPLYVVATTLIAYVLGS